MTTVKLNAAIDALGNLNLNVPVGLPPGNAEVLIVIQQAITETLTSDQKESRSGLFSDLPDMNVDIDPTLDGLNGSWKEKLSRVV